ncbi:hypothetical protein FQN55_002334 [Onygenales sp. PD_40]|nr:hypothetical protein FQN55_002334 [Onygenales sp. PD_40]KAK2786113.1 hypothetical protein FQN52_007993 [Onygenales sp. PD_12]
MAHEEALKFANLKLDTSFTQSPGLPDSRHIPTQDGHGRRAARGRADASHATTHDIEGSNSVLNELHTSTPPIAVPCPEDSHHAGNAHEELGYPHNPRYVQPSPLEQFARNRQPSISYNPELPLDPGNFQDPENAVADDARDSCEPNVRFRTREHRGSENSANELPLSPSRHPFFSPIPESFAVDTGPERPTSLTSLSTASPMTEELRTPPEAHRDILLSPFSASPRVQRPASLDDPAGWANAWPQPFGSRSKSYTLGRDGSLRQTMRQGSRRSTNSSGKSPASTFLSMWSRDEVPPDPDDEGQVVGTDYVIGKQIGFGGFSTVKEAFKVNEGGGSERTAVKIVKKHLAGQSEKENDQVQAEFDHEVRIWRYLHHPHILPLDAVYETDYATFCFTKLTTGGTLFDLVRRRRQGLGVTPSKKYAYQLASAIRYLHEDARVVHRDIKLENCLLHSADDKESGDISELILCDFGMAEWMTTDATSSSPDPYDNAADRPPPKAIGPSDTSTSVAGSLEYASPELLTSDQGLINPIVDVWAFGVVVFSLLVGSRPFQHPFPPRVRTNIIEGLWDRHAVLKGQDDLQERQDALDLLEGCLEMDPLKRWTIREAMEAPWFRDCSDGTDDAAIASQWRF